MILFSIILAIGCLCLAGAVWQWAAEKRDLVHHPAPGEFAWIDGRKIHYKKTGAGTRPTVIFDHGCGIGSSALIWKLVANKVSQFANVVVYDRAGYGWSDPGPYPQTNKAAVRDLRALIEQAGLDGPIILVGHSYGGLNVRLFAKKYPKLAAGLVLVDSMHEDEMTSRFPEKYVKGQLVGRKAFASMVYLNRVGILRLVGSLHLFRQLEEVAARFPEKMRKAYKSTFFLNKTIKTVASEFSNTDVGFHEVRGASLGSTPLVVIKSGTVENLNGFSEKEADDTKAALLSVAEEMSLLSANGELWIAETSGHNIHVEAPDLVAEAVKKVIADCGFDSFYA